MPQCKLQTIEILRGRTKTQPVLLFKPPPFSPGTHDVQ